LSGLCLKNMDFSFDKTAFKAQTFKEEQKTKNFQDNTAIERLEISFYLNSVAFGFDINNPPKMDRTFFSMRKLEAGG
jgi:hypothetical protein